MRQSSLCSQALLRSLPRRRRHCFAFSQSHGGEVWRVLTTTNGVGNVTRGEGGGGWHKALVVGSVTLWRRLLASRP